MDNKKIKEVIKYMAFLSIGLLAYGYIFNEALKLLNKASFIQNSVGFFLMSILCSVAILFVYISFKNYIKNNPENKAKTESKTD